MIGHKIQVQHLIISGSGILPTIPNPNTITPEDPSWVQNSDILIGQHAYNRTDDKWYYRTATNEIHELSANVTGSGSGSGTSVKNEIIINLDEDEIEGKQYHTFSNAFEYIGTQSDTYWSVRFSGYNTESISIPENVTVVGDDPNTSILAGSVGFESEGSEIISSNNIMNCTLMNLSVQSPVIPAEPITFVINVDSEYTPDKYTYNFSETPTTGIYSLQFGPYLTSPIAYNDDATAVRIAINSLDPYFIKFTVSGDYINGFTILPYNLAAGTAMSFSGNNIDLDVGITINNSVITGTPGRQLIEFSDTADSGVWQLKYLYNSKYYKSQQINGNTDPNSIQTAIEYLFRDIRVCEGIDLGINTVLVSDAGNDSFLIEFNGYPGHENMFEICDDLEPATNASYTGRELGMTTEVTITADNPGKVYDPPVDNMITLNYNGTDTINEVITAWNAYDPFHSVSLITGNGNQIPENKQRMFIANGYDETVYSLQTDEDSDPIFINCDNVRINGSTSTGNNAIILKNSSIFGGDLSSFKYYSIFLNSLIIGLDSSNPVILSDGCQINNSVIYAFSPNTIEFAGSIMFDNNFVSGLDYIIYPAGQYNFHFLNSTLLNNSGTLSIDNHNVFNFLNCSVDADIVINSTGTLNTINTYLSSIPVISGSGVWNCQGSSYNNSISGLTATNEKDAIDEIAAMSGATNTSTIITDVTYSELLTKITGSTLTVGGLYRITDFVQAYNIFDGGTNIVIEAQSGTTEPLIVTATSSNTLDKKAFSPAYPQDIIYYEPTGVNVIKDIGYSDGFGTLVANFKGVIEFRHDTKQNVSTWYDFRNIKFRRWAVDAVAYDSSVAYVARDVCKGSDGKIYKCISNVIAGQGNPSINTVNWMLWWSITTDAYISWTADNSMFAIGDITPTNLIFDTATYQDVYTFGDWYQHVNSVTIGKNELALLMDYGYNSALNNIVFKTIDDIYTCYSNKIGEISYNNTIGNNFYSNTIGNYFNRNTIGSYFYYNFIGSGFNSNTIGSDFNLNTIGIDFNSNIIGSYFYSNTIVSNFNSNTIGNGFGNNTIGSGFVNNTIGSYFNSNTIGNGFVNNTIGSGFVNNTIGNRTQVSAGINCQGNSIGNYNTQVTLGDECAGISIGEKNDAITLGASCTNLTFQNVCAFNTNTDVTGLQNCLFESGTSITGVDFTSSTHIKATYNKRVFTNASSVVRLSYFNAADTLTVVNVTD